MLQTLCIDKFQIFANWYSSLNTRTHIHKIPPILFSCLQIVQAPPPSRCFEQRSSSPQRYGLCRPLSQVIIMRAKLRPVEFRSCRGPFLLPFHVNTHKCTVATHMYTHTHAQSQKMKTIQDKRLRQTSYGSNHHGPAFRLCP